MFPSEKARASQGLLKSYHTIEKPQITQTVDDLVSIYCTWNLYMTQCLHLGQILISALSLKQSPVQLIIITIELQLMIIFSSIDPSVVKQKVQDQHSFIQR